MKKKIIIIIALLLVGCSSFEYQEPNEVENLPFLNPTIITTTQRPKPTITPIIGSYGVVAICGEDDAAENQFMIEYNPENEIFNIVLEEREGRYSYHIDEEARYQLVQVYLLALGINPEFFNNLSGLPDRYSGSWGFSMIRNQSAVSNDGNAVFLTDRFSEWNEETQTSDCCKFESFWASAENPVLSIIIQSDNSEFIQQAVRSYSTNELFFSGYHPDKNRYIYAVDLGKGTIENLTESNDVNPRAYAVSPDGKKLAYVSQESVWILDRKSDLLTQIELNGVRWLDWLSDNENLILSTDINLHRINMNDYKPERISGKFVGYGNFRNLEGSSDGRLIFWGFRNYYWELVIADVKTGERSTFITFSHTNDHLGPYFWNPIDWSPDEKWFSTEISFDFDKEDWGGDRKMIVCGLEETTCKYVDPTDLDDSVICNFGSWIQPLNK